MAFLFRGKLKAPATISTDTIIPLHWLDDTAVNQTLIMYFMMRFDDVLDPDRLRISLARLMDLGEWRKLGARLRQTV